MWYTFYSNAKESSHKNCMSHWNTTGILQEFQLHMWSAMPRRCIYLELFTHCWSFINSGQDCKVPCHKGLYSSSWPKTREVPSISHCPQLVPISHHWNWAEMWLFTPCTSRFKQHMSYAVVHLPCVVFWRRRVMGTAQFMVLLLLLGCPLLLFLGFCEGVITLSNVTIRQGENISKADQLKWISIPCSHLNKVWFSVMLNTNGSMCLQKNAEMSSCGIFFLHSSGLWNEET